MKFRFRLKNGKTHEFTVQDDAEVHRAIMLVSKKDKKKEIPKFIVIPDEVESVEALDI